MSDTELRIGVLIAAYSKLILELSEDFDNTDDDDQKSSISSMFKEVYEDYLFVSENESNKRKLAYVYIFRKPLSGHVKIGVSFEPNIRLKQINRGLPDKAYWVSAKLCKNPYEIEKHLHELFSEKRLLKTEWFNLDLDELDLAIQAIEEEKLMDNWLLKYTARMICEEAMS